MITPAKERMRKSRASRRLGLRPVQVLVSEQEIDFLLARHYELTRTDDRSIGSRGVSVPVQFSAGGGMTLSVELMLRAAEKITLVLEASATTRFGSIRRVRTIL